MELSQISTLEDIKKFLKGVEQINISAKGSKKETYAFLRDFLIKTKYLSRRKKEKGIMKEYLLKVTGYSERHLKRLIAKHKTKGLCWKVWQKNSYSKIYTNEDIALLHKVDSAHRMSGVGTKKVLEREYEVFKKEEYRKLRNISVSHIYNLRNSNFYLLKGRVFKETDSIKKVSIGIREKPKTYNKPGYFRVDTVHQGDLVIGGKNIKGVYFINLVDEVTQWEFVFCVIFISEIHIKKVIEDFISLCPFRILGFHSDNGSEFINKVIAALLEKNTIRQTKSRPRKSNDNALAESKNGSIIRKQFGYLHIPASKHNASLLNNFCVEYLNVYLNYHRPCAFPSSKVDRRGKEKKAYKYEDYQTPYEKLKSLKQADQYLKKGISFQDLEAIALNKSSTDFAIEMKKEKERVFLALDMQPAPN